MGPSAAPRAEGSPRSCGWCWGALFFWGGGLRGAQVGDFRDPCAVADQRGMRDVADQFCGTYDLLSGEDVSAASPEAGAAPGSSHAEASALKTKVDTLLRVLAGEVAMSPAAAPAGLEGEVLAGVQASRGDVFAALARVLCASAALSAPGAAGAEAAPKVSNAATGGAPVNGLHGDAGLLDAWRAAPAAVAVGGGHAGTLPSPVATAASSLLLLKDNTVLVDPSPGAGGPIARETNVVPLPSGATTVLTLALWARAGSLPVCTNRAGEPVAPFAVRSRVWGNYRATGSWYAGRISSVNPDGTFGLTYDDGDTEANVPEECVSDRKVRAPFAVVPAPALRVWALQVTALPPQRCHHGGRRYHGFIAIVACCSQSVCFLPPLLLPPPPTPPLARPASSPPGSCPLAKRTAVVDPARC
jgi:hypothetical protein